MYQPYFLLMKLTGDIYITLYTISYRKEKTMDKKKTKIMIVFLLIAELCVMIARNSLMDTLLDKNED